MDFLVGIFLYNIVYSFFCSQGGMPELGGFWRDIWGICGRNLEDVWRKFAGQLEDVKRRLEGKNLGLKNLMF